jgi:hypothetical protein
VNNPSDIAAFSSVLRRTTPDFNARMRNKIHLLEILKKAGIWLLDASIVGINEQKNSVRGRIILHCWRNFMRPELQLLSPMPEHIIIIGEGVAKSIGEEVGKLGIEHTVVPQPQAHLPGGYSAYYDQCFETCSRFRD